MPYFYSSQEQPSAHLLVFVQHHHAVLLARHSDATDDLLSFSPFLHTQEQLSTHLLVLVQHHHAVLLARHSDALDLSPGISIQAVQGLLCGIYQALLHGGQ